MARKTSTTTTPVSVSAPSVAAATASTTSKSKAVKSSKTDAPAASTKTAAPTPVAASTEASESSDAASSVGALFTEFSNKLQATSASVASLRSDFKALERQVARELRAAQKVNRRKRKVTNRAPSGFVKPTLISKDLAEFLGKPVGSELARTEVTRDINAYIRQHNLQDKENGRKINPDAKLRALLQLKKGDELTYFNLQKYMSPHFAKAGKTETASA